MIETISFGTSVASNTAHLVAARLLPATSASRLAPLATVAASRFLRSRHTVGGSSFILRRLLNSGKPKRAGTLAVPGAGVVAEAAEGGLDKPTNPETPVVNGTSLYSGLRQYSSLSDIGAGLDSLKNTTMDPSDDSSALFGKTLPSNAWRTGNPIRFTPPSPNPAKENKPIAKTWEVGSPIRFSSSTDGTSRVEPRPAPTAAPSRSSKSISSTPAAPTTNSSKFEKKDGTINDSIPSPLYEITDKPDSVFWSHLQYKARASKTTPLVKVLTTASQMDIWARRFLPVSNDSPKKNPFNIISLDLEWTLMTGTDARKTISVVQLAKEDLICIFHLASLPQGFSIPQTLKEVLEDERLIKCGVCIQGDASRLQRFLGVNVKGVLELSHLHQVLKHSEGLAAELAEAAKAEAAAAAVKEETTVADSTEEAEMADSEVEAEATAVDIIEKEHEEEEAAAATEDSEASTSEVDNKKNAAKKKPQKISKKIVSLAKLVEEYFGMPLDKGPVRCEPWHLKLGDDQVKYAAADAYAGVKLYEEMQKRRHAFDVLPEMPEVIHYLDDGKKTCTKWGILLPTVSEEKVEESTKTTASTMQFPSESTPQPRQQPPSASNKDLSKIAKIAVNWAEAYVRRLGKVVPTSLTLKDHEDYKLWLIAYALFQRHQCTAKETTEVVWPSQSSPSSLEVNLRSIGARPTNAEEVVLGWVSFLGVIEGLQVDRERMQQELVTLSRK